jgi:hypothetical protein
MDSACRRSGWWRLAHSAASSRKIGMPEQHLNDADVDAAFQEMRGETMPQRMRGDGFAQPGSPPRRPAGLLQRVRADMIVGS